MGHFFGTPCIFNVFMSQEAFIWVKVNDLGTIFNSQRRPFFFFLQPAVRETGVSRLITVTQLVNFDVKVKFSSFHSSFLGKDISGWIGIYHFIRICNNIPGVPKKTATCLTDYNSALCAPKLLTDGLF